VKSVSQQKIIIVQKHKLLQLTGILSKIFKKVNTIHTSAGYLHSHFVSNKIKYMSMSVAWNSVLPATSLLLE